jgi:hypothetical protein
MSKNTKTQKYCNTNKTSGADSFLLRDPTPQTDVLKG